VQVSPTAAHKQLSWKQLRELTNLALLLNEKSAIILHLLIHSYLHIRSKVEGLPPKVVKLLRNKMDELR